VASTITPSSKALGSAWHRPVLQPAQHPAAAFSRPITVGLDPVRATAHVRPRALDGQQHDPRSLRQVDRIDVMRAYCHNQGKIKINSAASAEITVGRSGHTNGEG
jgi:hypothetical protein